MDKIKTKFDIGDKVWYIDDNKVLSGSVTGIKVIKSKSINNVRYSINFEELSFIEDKLFGTKKELLETL